MKTILTMPTYLGNQLYPFGGPLSPHNINVNGISVIDIYLRYGENQDSKEDKKILEDYVRYFINAPCFYLSDEDKNEAETLEYDELFDLCLENGLDPF